MASLRKSCERYEAITRLPFILKILLLTFLIILFIIYWNSLEANIFCELKPWEKNYTEKVIGKMKLLKYLDIRRFSKMDRYYFLFNIVLGLGTLLFFVLTRNTPVQQSLINMLFDEVIELRTGLFELGRKSDAEIAAEDVIILSFDDSNMKAWRYPTLTPRNKIADMIRFAYEGGASVIVLDMELSDSDYSPASKFLGDSKIMTGQERDKELFNLLEQIKNDDDSNTRVLISGDLHAEKTLKENDFAKMIDNKKIYAASTYVSPYSYFLKNR